MLSVPLVGVGYVNVNGETIEGQLAAAQNVAGINPGL